jgi:hypothetical protein
MSPCVRRKPNPLGSDQAGRRRVHGATPPFCLGRTCGFGGSPRFGVFRAACCGSFPAPVRSRQGKAKRVAQRRPSSRKKEPPALFLASRPSSHGLGACAVGGASNGLSQEGPRNALRGSRPHHATRPPNLLHAPLAGGGRRHPEARWGSSASAAAMGVAEGASPEAPNGTNCARDAIQVALPRSRRALTDVF